MARLKPFYTLPELAAAMKMSRWTVRRWLEANKIPYELRRKPGSKRGGGSSSCSRNLRIRAPGMGSMDDSAAATQLCDSRSGRSSSTDLIAHGGSDDALGSAPAEKRLMAL